MKGYDAAIDTLATDVADPSLTVDQVIHTAECISVAYGPPAQFIVAEAIAEAKMRRWEPPVRMWQ